MLLIGELALATAALTVTLCKAKVAAPLRRILFRVGFIREMMSCLYCASHWAAAGLVLVAWPGDCVTALVTWLATVTLAAPAMFVINWSHGSMQWSDHE